MTDLAMFAELIATLIQPWLDELLSDHAPSTIARYSSVLRRFLGWYAAETQHVLELTDLTPILVVGYCNALQQTEAPSTVNTHVAALRSWGAWLTTHGFVADNPAGRLKPVQRQTPPAPGALSTTEVNALLRETQRGRYPARDYALVQMLLQTGMRIGECSALSWEDLTLSEKQGSVLIRAGNGNKARSLPLNRSIRQALVAYLAPFVDAPPTMQALLAAWPATGARPRPLWWSQKGRLTLISMERVIKDLVRGCARRGLVPAAVTPQRLRHTFATRYLAAYPGDLVGLAQLLGHSSLNATRVYVHATTEHLAERVDQIDLNAYG